VPAPSAGSTVAFARGPGSFVVMVRGGFGEAVAENVEAEEIGRPGAGLRAGDDAEDFLRLDEAALFEDGFRVVDHLFGGEQLGTFDGMDAPEHGHAVNDRVDAGERVRWAAWGGTWKADARSCRIP